MTGCLLPMENYGKPGKPMESFFSGKKPMENLWNGIFSGIFFHVQVLNF